MLFEHIRHWLQFSILYLGRPPWDTGISPPELEAFIASHPPGKALDLGCGTGTNLIRLAQAGWEVTGVDFAGIAVAAARRKLRQNGLEGRVILGDVTDLSHLAPPYDLILDIGCYHGLPEALRSTYRNNISTLLADSGTFLVYVHLKSAPDSRMGVADAEIKEFHPALSLHHRADGTDRFGRKTAWLEYQRKDGS